MIPTFNEAENIQSLIEEIIKVDKQIEVLVVDDDSPDGTAVLVEEISRKDSRVHLIWRKDGLSRSFHSGRGALFLPLSGIFTQGDSYHL
jgi:dolichol-phosphate mannosyltransferase